MKQELKGRGAQIKVKNKFLKNEYAVEHIEGVDIPDLENTKTQYIAEHPKKIVNKVYSPTVPFNYSMNPYQGCEHGCIWSVLVLECESTAKCCRLKPNVNSGVGNTTHGERLFPLGKYGFADLGPCVGDET